MFYRYLPLLLLTQIASNLFASQIASPRQQLRNSLRQKYRSVNSEEKGLLRELTQLKNIIKSLRRRLVIERLMRLATKARLLKNEEGYILCHLNNARLEDVIDNQKRQLQAFEQKAKQQKEEYHRVLRCKEQQLYKLAELKDFYYAKNAECEMEINDKKDQLENLKIIIDEQIKISAKKANFLAVGVRESALHCMDLFQFLQTLSKNIEVI